MTSLVSYVRCTSENNPSEGYLDPKTQLYEISILISLVSLNLPDLTSP